MAETKKPNQTSLRNPLAALATVFEKLGETETRPAYREQRQREAQKLRELAAKEQSSGQYPLRETDLAAISAISRLIRDHTPIMSPREMRSASAALLALEQMPYVTPGVVLSFGFRTTDRNGNWGWADIEIHSNEFRLGLGEHFYDDAVGGDTESRTVFETQAGSTWREGEMDGWLEHASVYASEGQLIVEDHSDYEAIDWSLNNLRSDQNEE